MISNWYCPLSNLKYNVSKPVNHVCPHFSQESILIRIYNQVEKVKGENQGISKFEYFGIFVVIPFICIVTQFICFLFLCNQFPIFVLMQSVYILTISMRITSNNSSISLFQKSFKYKVFGYKITLTNPSWY